MSRLVLIHTSVRNSIMGVISTWNGRDIDVINPIELTSDAQDTHDRQYAISHESLNEYDDILVDKGLENHIVVDNDPGLFPQE